MSRHNRLTQQVFGEIIGTDERVSSYDQFLSTDKGLNIDETPEIKDCKKLYLKIINNHKTEFEELAKLEETIVQLRCREMVMEDFKLSKVREYIYARALFFRPGKDVKDIRVVVGRTDIYGENLDTLLENTSFIQLEQSKLKEAMTEEIVENLSYVERLKMIYNVEK